MENKTLLLASIILLIELSSIETLLQQQRAIELAHF